MKENNWQFQRIKALLRQSMPGPQRLTSNEVNMYERKDVA